jgi:arylsulfatase A-like enzyme
MDERRCAFFVSLVVPVVFVACAALTAYRLGGAADEFSVVHHNTKMIAKHDLRKDDDAYEARLRLVEVVGDARYDAPRSAEALVALAAYRWKAPVPWFAFAPNVAARVASIALHANARTFDQREAIVAPAPATVTFRLDIPARAKLTFSSGVVAARGTTTFKVVLVDASDALHTVFTTRVTAENAESWVDASADLTPFAGQSVALSFLTETDGGAGKASLAVWGNPTLLATPSRAVPYNVLWVVMGAHDPGRSMPVLNELATRGVTFSHAYSAGTWTRPSTLSMLAGARASELGVESFEGESSQSPFALSRASRAAYYALTPPLLPRILRATGVVARAFVNNETMLGYETSGIDMGFERVEHHASRDVRSSEIARSAASWIGAHGNERFFVFCKFGVGSDSERFANVPLPNAANDNDDALGVLLEALNATGARDRTLVVVTAEAGQAPSVSETGRSRRERSAIANYEETTRIPLIVAFPRQMFGGNIVGDRVRSTDIAPTVLDVEGLPRNTRMSGRSLLPLIRGEHEPDARVVLSEGQGSRAILSGTYRLIVHAATPRARAFDELFDLQRDPREQNDLAGAHPEIVAEMRARLEAAEKNVPTADSYAGGLDARQANRFAATLRLRFAGGGAVHRISGSLIAQDAQNMNAMNVSALGVDPSAFTKIVTTDGPQRIDLALVTATDALVGFDVEIEPAESDVRWNLFLDDVPWPSERVYAGPFGLAAPHIVGGIASDASRFAALAPRVAEIDPVRDFGLFVTRHQAEGAFAK